MQLGFYFDQTRCIGCFACCVACKDWHDVPAGRANWLRVCNVEEGEFPALFVAYLFYPCFHCTDPPCVAACPVGAISKRKEDGIVLVKRDLCLGGASCGKCKEACPYRAPQFGEEEDAKMQKCNLCVERWQEKKKPVCVEACPMWALDAAPLDELRAKYGDLREMAGFVYASDAKPSVTFKRKNRTM